MGCPPNLESSPGTPRGWSWSSGGRPLRASLQVGLQNRELPPSPESLVLLGKLMQRRALRWVAEGRDLGTEDSRRANPATQGQELEMASPSRKLPMAWILEGPEVVPGLHAGSHTPRVDHRLSGSPPPRKPGLGSLQLPRIFPTSQLGTSTPQRELVVGRMASSL